MLADGSVKPLAMAKRVLAFKLCSSPLSMAALR
jgi:hypothetical protein